SIIFQLSFLRDAIQHAESVDGLLTEINDALQEAIQITRDLSVDLSPPVLHNEGLLEAITWLAHQMQQQHGLEVGVESNGPLPTLNEDLRVLLFQTVRELLFNVVKHTDVREAVVRVGYVEGEFQIEVSDQGQGFNLSEVRENQKNTQGLLRIGQRLQL